MNAAEMVARVRPAALSAGAVANPALIWVWLGAIFFVFEVYVLCQWALGANFVPTDPGPDPISRELLMFLRFLEIAVPFGASVMVWKLMIQPWIRNGRITTDGRIVFVAMMVFFWDMSLNYSSIALFYNSHFMNHGAWANGAWPSWFSPTGHLLPEPFPFVVPAYLSLVFSQALLMCWILRKAQNRARPFGVVMTVALMVVGITIIDSIIEITLLRTGMYAYPGAIHALTLWAGETYQFPLTEGFLFGGLGVTSTAAVWHFRDDKGHSFVEHGIERLRYPALVISWMRTLAIFGFVHTAFFILYFIPSQFVTLNADPFPKGYPSYMTNGMCVYGVNSDQCPGPGVMMPRPPFPPIGQGSHP